MSSKPGSSEKQLKILHVEDAQADAELIERELRRAKMSVIIRRVDDETSYAAALDEFRPDVILSDHSMPSFSGVRALAIRNQKAPDIPFIYASGTIGEEAAIEALHNGATDYVLKGNLKRLPSAIQRALGEFAERKARRLAEAEIARQSAFLRQVIDLDPNFIFAKDRSGRFVLVNQAVADAYGVTVAKLLGKTDADFNANADEVRHFRKLDLEVMDTLHERFIPEETITDASGKLRWLQTTKRPIFDKNGERNMVLGVSTDITARREAEQRIRQLNRIHAVLSGINEMIARVRSRDELFREACRIVVEVGQFAAAYVAMLDPDLQKLRLVVSSNSETQYLKSLQIAFDDASPERRRLFERIFGQRQPLVWNDVEREAIPVALDVSRSINTRAVCVLPLVIADKTQGIFVLRSREAGFFDEDEVKLLVELAGDIAYALDHLDKADRLNYLAYYDQLTGLANATLFRERLTQYLHTAGSKKQPVALVLLDVERFKTVNDALGRQAGDSLLKQLAGRLADCAGGVEEVAHLGTDHFAIVLPNVANEQAVARIMEDRVRRCLDKTFILEGIEFKAAAKFGIALYPEDGADHESLFRNAEAALKKAKAGGERYLFYTEQMTERVAERLSLENKLRQALEREEFVLHYQPKVDGATGRLVGVEALIRWNDPVSGLVPPNSFIPLLEETGLIREVGTWALRRAVRDHNHWLDAGLEAPRIAVNVSAIQLRQKDFVELVRQSLAAGPSPPGVDLEITESLIMEDIEGNIGKLNAIREMGLNIAIDDFGTGYSSLAYLAKLPVRTLKIDRSFIIAMLQDRNTMTLVSTIISLAHSLELLVIAEGVELEEQARMLRLLRCDKMQGYLYGKPMPLAEMSTFIRKNQTQAA